MKIAHWTAFNGSGMNAVAESIHLAEKAAGHDSVLCNCHDDATESMWEQAKDADVHVTHTHFPEWFRRRARGRDYKQVYVMHGTPEHVFTSSVEEGLRKGHGHGDSWMLCQHWLQTSDAVVTFWPRHEWFLRSLVDKRTIVSCFPLGVDLGFWKPGPSDGKFSGDPSVLTAENCHRIKWPLDLFLAWPHVDDALPNGGSLHAFYLPSDQHRWFFPLVNRNRCSYAAHISSGSYLPPGLRNAFRSVDFYIGLVRYGDFNRISLEANATGCKTISYRGNPFSDYWVTEGDQRILVDELIGILSGRVPPRDKTKVPNVSVTAQGFIDLYGRL